MSNLPPPPPPGGGSPPPSGGGFNPGAPPPGGGYEPPSGGGFGSPGGPPPPGVPGPLAEWQDRVVSGLIDFGAPLAVAALLAFVVGPIVDLNTSLYFSPVNIGFNLLAVAWVLYNGYLAGETGQSFGMKQSGLRLVGEATGQPIGGSQGVVRNLLFLTIGFCGCFWPVIWVDALFPLWDEKKQTLRDKIAKSVVVKVG